MIVNVQKRIEFNSPKEVLYDEEDLRKAIIWYSHKPVCRLKNVYLHGRYYAVSIHYEKIHIHRLLMKYWKQRDLSRREHVHHIDGNRFNNLKENLELMPAGKHISHHVAGVPLSEEHRAKISLSNKRRKGIKLKRKYTFLDSDLIAIKNNTETLRSISRKYGCASSTVSQHYKEYISENPSLLEEAKGAA